MQDSEMLEEFLEHLADRFTGAEIVDLLEDAGVITVYDVIAFLEEFIVEGRRYLE